LRSEYRVDAREAPERKDGSLDGEVAQPPVYPGEGWHTLGPEVSEPGPGHDPGGHIGQRETRGLAHERDRPRGPRVGLEDVGHVVPDGELDVEEAPYPQGPGDRRDGRLDPVQNLVGER